jgi:hypothetical protein
LFEATGIGVAKAAGVVTIVGVAGTRVVEEITGVDRSAEVPDVAVENVCNETDIEWPPFCAELIRIHPTTTVKIEMQR